MQRRGFLKFLGMAAPVAIANALSKAHEPERPMYILTENVKPLKSLTWSDNPIEWYEAPVGSSEFAHLLSVQRFNAANFPPRKYDQTFYVEE